MTPDEIINALGGTGSVARELEVTPSAVSQWRINGIPKVWMRVIKLENPHIFCENKDVCISKIGVLNAS
jgi:hypothetical protein